MAFGGDFDSSLNNVAGGAISSIPTGISVNGSGLSFTNNNSNTGSGITPLDVYASVLFGDYADASKYTTLTLKDTNEIYNIDGTGDINQTYVAFNDISNQTFLHRLDRGNVPIPPVSISDETDIYLTSFQETGLYSNNNIMDNEDPVSFGYDLIINYATSPLFNGSVENFINQFPNYKELNSRLSLIAAFKSIFYKFFKINSPNSIGIENPPRTYYLKKLQGLNNLMQTTDKQFVDYGKDFLTLGLYEDVSVNMGYLVALYKELSWSRVNGKKMIPDNLLRFDLDIVITEAKKYNRVIKNDDGTLSQFADLTSRYRYTLYECQFMFDEMSHGDNIDMSSLNTNDSFDIKINYKYTTLAFDSFVDSPSFIDDNGNMVRQNQTIDNSYIDISAIKSEDSSSYNIINNTLVINPTIYTLNQYGNGYKPIPPSQKDMTDDEINSQSIIEQIINGKNVAVGNALTYRDQLLKATLDNIQNQFGLSLANIAGTLVSRLNSGFTEDGYEYNIAAYLINKTENNILNSFNNTLNKALSGIKADIYAVDVFAEQNLGTNNLFSGNNKHFNIYGNNKTTPLIYSGDNIPNPEPRNGNSVNTSGFGPDGFEYNLEAWKQNRIPVANKTQQQKNK